jgi:hypothetical protein
MSGSVFGESWLGVEPSDASQARDELAEYHAYVTAELGRRRRRAPNAPAVVSSTGFVPMPTRSAQLNPVGLDVGERPGALSDKQLMVNMRCAVCLHQKANVVCLPCGHLAMCEWCAAQAVPSAEGDRTRPADRAATCPQCRAVVVQKVN